MYKDYNCMSDNNMEGAAPYMNPMDNMYGMQYGMQSPMYPNMNCMMNNMMTAGEMTWGQMCYNEHMSEYMAYMCKAEASRMRAMQCMQYDEEKE